MKLLNLMLFFLVLFDTNLQITNKVANRTIFSYTKHQTFKSHVIFLVLFDTNLQITNKVANR